MNRLEFVEALAGDLDTTKAEADRVLTAVEDRLTLALEAGGEVELRKLGRFGVKHRPASEGRHPRTGEPITIAARRVPFFRPGKALRDAVQPPARSVPRRVAGR